MTSNLLINEFMFNPSVSGDPNEFIEVKGDADTDYSEWSLIVVDGDGSSTGGSGTGTDTGGSDTGRVTV